MCIPDDFIFQSFLPSRHTTSFQRLYDVADVVQTSYRCWNDVVCLLGRQWILSELVDVLQIGCFKKLANFARKHLCWSLFLIKLKTWSPSTPFFTEHLQWLFCVKQGSTKSFFVLSFQSRIYERFQHPFPSPLILLKFKQVFFKNYYEKNCLKLVPEQPETVTLRFKKRLF